MLLAPPTRIVDKTEIGDPISLYLVPKTTPIVAQKVELRDYQKSICEAVLRELRKKGPRGCLILAKCGVGKTFMAIYIAKTLGVRVAVLLHKSGLVDQWVEQFKKLWPEVSVGIVRGAQEETEGHGVVIFMIQTVVRRAYKRNQYNGFGLVINDESHRICAKTFSRCLKHFPARCRLGLTATPNRADGLGYSLSWMLGGPICQVARSKDTVKTVRVRCLTDDSIYGPPKRNYRGKILYPSFMTRLVNNESRSRRIAGLVAHLYQNCGRKVMVASARRNHLEYLFHCIHDLIECPCGNPTECDIIGLYVHETKKKRALRREEKSLCGALC